MEKGFFDKNSASKGSRAVGASTKGPMVASVSSDLAERGMNVNVVALNSRILKLKGLDDGHLVVTQPRKAVKVIRNPSLVHDRDMAVTDDDVVHVEKVNDDVVSLFLGKRVNSPW